MLNRLTYMDLIHNIDDQRRFITTNITAFARFAYGGYREVGKGVVVAVPEEFQGGPGDIGTGNFYYLKRSDLADFIHQWTYSSLDEERKLHEVWYAVESYDPEASIVVVFLHGSGTMNVHHVVCSTPPATAYAAYTN